MLLDQPGIYLISPQSYLSFLALLKKCKLIISDSGGLQEEALTFGKRILITRLTTERPEVIESGFGQLVGYDSGRIIQLVAEQFAIFDEMDLVTNPFGNGDSSNIIVHTIINELGRATGEVK
jgi:UDP-N-acetylglucosamine 2-epimerase